MGLGGRSGWITINLGHIGIQTPNLHCTEGTIPTAGDYLVPGHTDELRHETNKIHASHSADSCGICGAHSGGGAGYDNVPTGKQLPTFRSCYLQLHDVCPSWTKEEATSFETSATIYQ